VEFYTVTEIQKDLGVSLQSVYKKIKTDKYKADKYKNHIIKIKGVMKVSSALYKELKIDCGIEQPHLVKIVETKDEIALNELKFKEKIELLESINKLQENRIEFLEDENVDLRKMLHKNLDIINQEQQLNLKALSNTEQILYQKRLEIAAKNTENIKEKGFFQRIFSS
jgi:predicted transcriptional regulator